MSRLRTEEIEFHFRRVGLEPQYVNGGWCVTLNGFTFTFRNYYTAVDGPVPLAVAEELYAVPIVGKSDIRSGGDCGCREPKTWTTRYKGKQVVMSRKEYEELLKWSVPNEQGQVSEIAKQALASGKWHFPASEEEYQSYPQYVETYHIDSELGLYIFLQILRKHKLIP